MKFPKWLLPFILLIAVGTYYYIQKNNIQINFSTKLNNFKKGIFKKTSNEDQDYIAACYTYIDRKVATCIEYPIPEKMTVFERNQFEKKARNKCLGRNSEQYFLNMGLLNHWVKKNRCSLHAVKAKCVPINEGKPIKVYYNFKIKFDGSRKSLRERCESSYSKWIF